MIQKVVLLGSGKLAWNLGSALKNAGREIVSVYSRTIENAQGLALHLSSSFTDQFQDIPSHADLYVIAVADSAIVEVMEALRPRLGERHTVVHCSGASSVNTLKGDKYKWGVFYPFQTFTKEHLADFANLPIGVDSPHENTLQELLELAGMLSQQVYQLDDGQRKQLHIAGVFANNFVNQLYQIAFNLLAEEKISSKILHNIIIETAKKALEKDPFQIQTGPAVRGDLHTIRDHEKLLTDKDVYLKIYQLITESIINDHRQ